ncbi:MAG: UTP--glucose-1-phosphate uridylyltransferase [Planctomycetota bacterium]|jgi:UDP-N-acetylglucosamine/UDP-N-acetylgalactosamine diphosphorylase
MASGENVLGEMGGRAQEVRSAFSEAGQGHVFRTWEALDDLQRGALLAQLASVDLTLCRRMPALEGDGPGWPKGAKIEALPYIPLPRTASERRDHEEALRVGEEALRGGRVGAFLAAGGQGARLGFEGPKGKFPIGPVTNRTLFQLFTEAVLAHARRWTSPIPLAVMTSRENHEETGSYFASKGRFGLGEEDLRFFPQRMLPAFSREGKILMRSAGEVFMSPDGHGGAFRVLTEGGALEWFRSRGIDTLFYFQVDNPLLPVLDPVFLGHHLKSGSQFTTKVARKKGPEERMGVFALVDGLLRVVEYLHLPPALAKATDEEGRLRFWAGNVAVHAIDLSFVERFGRALSLPTHVACKPAQVLDPEGGDDEPKVMDALKLETFIFDAIPMAERAVVVEVDRAEEFGPVKGAEGEDTPEAARRMMVWKAARWLEAAGVKVPRDAAGEPCYPIEISPLTALFPRDLENATGPATEVTGPMIF